MTTIPQRMPHNDKPIYVSTECFFFQLIVFAFMALNITALVHFQCSHQCCLQTQQAAIEGKSKNSLSTPCPEPKQQTAKVIWLT